ncbi:hypothetical protein [Sediminibacillus massiliensis]|uniref:hypothetical protein n=1 Tax=Sediminibacillus massiliensis TaxID=1926277 RepID=UPI00098889F3|nr:hypothetical protein [Sediminibacillus massiliensis]
MNPGWLFVLAAVIAVTGIVVAFKQMAGTAEKRLEEGKTVTTESFQKETTRFFIKVAIIEVIPILLIVFGFVQIESYNANSLQLMFPILFILVILLFGMLNVILTRTRLMSIKDLSEQSRAFVNSTIFIGIGLVSTIPIIGVVAILTMGA